MSELTKNTTEPVWAKVRSWKSDVSARTLSSSSLPSSSASQRSST